MMKKQLFWSRKPHLHDKAGARLHATEGTTQPDCLHCLVVRAVIAYLLKESES